MVVAGHRIGGNRRRHDGVHVPATTDAVAAASRRRYRRPDPGAAPAAAAAAAVDLWLCARHLAINSSTTCQSLSSDDMKRRESSRIG